MGSGKGKSRRTQTGTAAGAESGAAVLEGFWEKFLIAQKLTGKTLTGYYLNLPLPGDCALTILEAEKLVQEFFQDLVTIGAVFLPNNQKVEDFSLQIKIGGRQEEALFLRNVQNGKEYVLKARPRTWLNAYAELWNGEMRDFLYFLSAGLKALA